MKKIIKKIIASIDEILGNSFIKNTNIYLRLIRKLKINKAFIGRQKNTHITIGKYLNLGAEYKKGFARSTLLRMGNGSEMHIKGAFSFYYGCDIQIFDGGKLYLGSGFVNSDTKIRCKNKIVIGDDVAISHDILIIDCNGHNIDGKKDVGKPIYIGNHVWIGSKCIILKGVTIGDNAIIAAGTIVKEDVPPNVVFGGNPGRIIRGSCTWN